MLIRRLRSEFRLATLTLFGVTGVLGITPFAVYRFVRGEPLAGTIDLLIVLSIGALTLYAWRRGRIDRVCLLAALAGTGGCVASIAAVGLDGALWIHAALLANFLLVSRGRAVLVSALGIGMLALLDALLDIGLPVGPMVASALVVSLFAFIFASHTELQHRQLQAAAALDPLTGAYNRRGMDEELQIALDASVRTGMPLGLAVLDLDHFKQVNDSFGHEAGDAVLVQLAELVRRRTRKGDRFFRLGGEEFALLLPGADAAALRSIAEDLRAAVEREVHCDAHRVTISIGATPLAGGESTSAWLGRADAAMYRAKREGRNRVVVVEAPRPLGPALLRYQPPRNLKIPGC